MNISPGNALRLSDRILYALDLALEQGDLDISDQLFVALEKSLTRGAGGGEFVERRTYPEELTSAKERIDQLRAEKDGVSASAL